MLVIWLFVLTPLVLFLAAYIIETYVSFRRLQKPRKGHDYLDATWEVTHTFLVVSVALFVGFFSQNLTEIAYVVFYPLFLTSVFVGVRTLAYIYIFIIRSPKKRNQRTWIDTVFALSHVGVVAGLLYLLAMLIPKLLSIELLANTAFIPWMLPGAALVIVVCSLPLLSLYATKK